MDEDELLAGLMDACYVGGWLCHHIRRSDLGLQEGHAGFPDIVAVHPERHALVVLELKDDANTIEPLQAAWLTAMRDAGVDARLVRPPDYDATWRYIVGDRLIERRRWTDDPDER